MMSQFIEDERIRKMSTLNTAIARLRRTGDEQSKTTQKIIDAANEVATAVVQSQGQLPQGYRIFSVVEEDGKDGERLALWHDNVWYYFSPKEMRLINSQVWIYETTLDGARLFADDVAAGLFDGLLNKGDTK